MTASSDMFVTVMQQTQLSQNEIENYIFDIAQKNSTDDHDVIADIFLQQHGGDVAASTAADDVHNSRAEIKIFLRGCADLEDQRVVRSRKSVDNCGAALGSTVAAATMDIAPTTVSDKGKERMRQQEEGGHGRSTKKSRKTQGGGDKGESRSGRHAVEDDEVEGGSNGTIGTGLNRMTMTSLDQDEAAADHDSSCAVVVEAELPEPVLDANEEIVDKEAAYDKLQEMRVTLEQDSNSENVNKNPPNTARQVLSGLRVNKQMMTHCITRETDNTKVIQSCVTDQKCNYYCFVSKMDPKGSTPPEILDIIYCIDMMQRYYTNQRPMPNGRDGGEELFDVPKLGPNSGHSMRQNGAVFHKIYDNDEAVTVLIVKMKIFIEQANTGGKSPLVMFFMFLVVEVPLTFDFVDTVYRSCTKNAMGREKLVCDDMKRIWVNIAH